MSSQPDCFLCKRSFLLIARLFSTHRGNHEHEPTGEKLTESKTCSGYDRTRYPQRTDHRRNVTALVLGLVASTPGRISGPGPVCRTKKFRPPPHLGRLSATESNGMCLWCRSNMVFRRRKRRGMITAGTEPHNTTTSGSQHSARHNRIEVTIQRILIQWIHVALAFLALDSELGPDVGIHADHQSLEP